MKMRRVGTFTFGIGLVFFGVLFLLRIFIKVITFELVFNLWPLLFIFLGCEILVGHYKEKEGKMYYDRGAIFLIIVLTFFAMAMAGMQFIYEHGNIAYYY